MNDFLPKIENEEIDEIAEFSFAELAELAAILCKTPIAFVNLNGREDKTLVKFQKFAFEMHAHLKPFRVFIVEDALLHKRFSQSIFVKDSPHIRFYAGILLNDGSDKIFGSLCVLDYRPRVLDSEQIDALKLVARQIVSQYELRRNAANNEHILQLNDKIIAGLQTEFDALETAEKKKSETPAKPNAEKIVKYPFSASLGKKQSSMELNLPKTREKTSEAVPQMLSKKHILIADPSSQIRQMLKQYGVIWGLDAVETESGEETLRLLRRGVKNGKPFDLVVIDTNLPDWEGFALARQIKTDADLSKTQIVLTTAYGQRVDAALAHEIGVAGYLTKPLHGSQVFDCLVAALANNAPVSEKNESVLPPPSNGNSGNKRRKTTNFLPPYTDKNTRRNAEKLPLLDAKTFRLTADDANDKEFARENFNLYLSETEKKLDEIKNALENENPRAIAQLTNSICGNSLAVGAKKIAVIANRIAESAKKGEMKKVALLLKNFIEEFSQLQTELVEIGDSLISFNQKN